MELSPGLLIGNKYELVRPLARGGMGSVWVARHAHLDMAVALKFMTPTSKMARERFEREAKAAARLRSPHVVDIHDYGFERNVPYIVMELLEGEDLGARLKREKQLPLPTAARIANHIARALKRAHEAGIVHRDLKPANIFLARDDDGDVTKILDFGVIKNLKPSTSDEPTATGMMVGTVQYMSPEQTYGSKNIDHRSDLWSLGVILFRAVTGYMPFSGFSVMDIVLKITAGRIPAPSHFAPELSAEVDAFFKRALSRDQAQRFQSAQEMAEAFALVAHSHSSPPVRMSASAGARLSDHAIELSLCDLVTISSSDAEMCTGIDATTSSDQRTTNVIPRRTSPPVMAVQTSTSMSGTRYENIALSVHRRLFAAHRVLGVMALAIVALATATSEAKPSPRLYAVGLSSVPQPKAETSSPPPPAKALNHESTSRKRSKKPRS